MERIRKGYWTAIGMIVVWSGFTTLMLVVFPVPLFRIFIPDDHVLQTGVSYLRIMGYSQILMCLEITSSGAFQGLGRPMPPTLAGIIGNAARIPLAVFLSATVLGLDGVWWSISISSIAKGIVVFTWFVVILRRYTHRRRRELTDWSDCPQADFRYCARIQCLENPPAGGCTVAAYCIPSFFKKEIDLVLLGSRNGRMTVPISAHPEKPGS